MKHIINRYAIRGFFIANSREIIWTSGEWNSRVPRKDYMCFANGSGLSVAKSTITIDGHGIHMQINS